MLGATFSEHQKLCDILLTPSSLKMNDRSRFDSAASSAPLATRMRGAVLVELYHYQQLHHCREEDCERLCLSGNDRLVPLSLYLKTFFWCDRARKYPNLNQRSLLVCMPDLRRIFLRAWSVLISNYILCTRR